MTQAHAVSNARVVIGHSPRGRPVFGEECNVRDGPATGQLLLMRGLPGGDVHRRRELRRVHSRLLLVGIGVILVRGLRNGGHRHRHGSNAVCEMRSGHIRD